MTAPIFTEGFDRTVCHGETITAEVNGFTLVARIEHDDNATPPWEREEGHGPVSDWTVNDKAPGQRVLCSDRGMRRYYDFAEAVKIAKRDGWDAELFGQGTKAQRAARAAEADFRRLRAWCSDEWTYVGVIVSVSRNGIVLDRHGAACWGIESDCGDFLTEMANEMAGEALDAGRKALALLCTCDDDETAGE